MILKVLYFFVINDYTLEFASNIVQRHCFTYRCDEKKHILRDSFFRQPHIFGRRHFVLVLIFQLISTFVICISSYVIMIWTY